MYNDSYMIMFWLNIYGLFVAIRYAGPQYPAKKITRPAINCLLEILFGMKKYLYSFYEIVLKGSLWK